MANCSWQVPYEGQGRQGWENRHARWLSHISFSLEGLLRSHTPLWRVSPSRKMVRRWPPGSFTAQEFLAPRAAWGQALGLNFILGQRLALGLSGSAVSQLLGRILWPGKPILTPCPAPSCGSRQFISVQTGDRKGASEKREVFLESRGRGRAAIQESAVSSHEPASLAAQAPLPLCASQSGFVV